MVSEKIYIYGIHTCLSQIENNPENINKIYIKNSSLNKNLQNILDIAKQRDIIVSQCEKTSMDALILSLNLMRLVSSSIVLQFDSKLIR